MKKGILYGIGVGPGDPELMTMKAFRLINASNYIACPTKIREDAHAYRIASALIPDMDKKNYVGCQVPMTKDEDVLSRSYADIVQRIEGILDTGEDVAFLTIGDPCVYSTYISIHNLARSDGYESLLVSGVPSFCAAAAHLGISLAKGSEQLHIIPSSYDISDALELSGNKVLMKAGNNMTAVKKTLCGSNAQVLMVENCGMENEKITRGASAIDENAGYLSLLFVGDELY